MITPSSVQSSSSYSMGSFGSSTAQDESVASPQVVKNPIIPSAPITIKESVLWDKTTILKNGKAFLAEKKKEFESLFCVRNAAEGITADNSGLANKANKKFISVATKTIKEVEHFNDIASQLFSKEIEKEAFSKETALLAKITLASRHALNYFTKINDAVAKCSEKVEEPSQTDNSVGFVASVGLLTLGLVVLESKTFVALTLLGIATISGLSLASRYFLVKNNQTDIKSSKLALEHFLGTPKATS